MVFERSLCYICFGHTWQSLCLSNTQTTKANIWIKHCSSRILSSVLSNNHWFFVWCIHEFWQLPVLVCHSIFYIDMLSILAIDESLFVWAIHRPQKLAWESNTALPGYYLFYQIIIGFSSDGFTSSGKWCLFVIQFFTSMSCQYWPFITLSLSEQYTDHQS